MSPTTYLITGANRGLGLEFVRQILAKEPQSRIIAAARNPAAADDLQKLVRENAGRLETLKLDVSSQESIQAAAEQAAKLELAKDGIDILFNNAGVNSVGTASVLDDNFFDGLSTNLATNVLGVGLTTKAFLPLLRQGAQKAVWMMSSTSGSHASQSSAQTAAYCVSKAALNMMSQKFAKALEGEGFTVLMLHPGWVRTDMGGANGEIDVEESIAGSLETLHSKTKADNGSFWKYDGSRMPW